MDLSIFKHKPAFIAEDSRKHRLFNPITLVSLTAKCEAMLPLNLIQGKKVLDLGSCIGAMGHWALSKGAIYYHAVEIQNEFVEKSQSLLSHWGEKAYIEEGDIRAVLQGLPDNAYDVVVASAVLQVFNDPQTVLKQMCRVSNDLISIEATSPPLIRSGTIAPHLKIIEFTDAACNSQDGLGQFEGAAAIISRNAIEHICNLNGFEREKTDLSPPVHKETIAYQASSTQAVPFRYFDRFHYIGEPDSICLEEIVKTNCLEYFKDWDSSSLPDFNSHQA